MTGLPSDVFSRDEAFALCRRMLGMTTVKDAQVYAFSTLETKNTFVRGDSWMASEAWQTGCSIEMSQDGRTTQAVVTQTDEASMRAAVDEAEAMLRVFPAAGSPTRFLPKQVYPEGPKIRFESTLEAMAVERRSETCRGILETIERQGVIGAGNVRWRLNSSGGVNTAGMECYTSTSYSEVNVSARTADGTGAGWAWSGYEDWARIDPSQLAARAADLARRSANPVAVEPGRYTVILEPNVVATLLWALFGWAEAADGGGTPFSTKPAGGNKIGLKMLDERMSLTTDIWDPELPVPTVGKFGPYPKENVTWYDRGILTNLGMSNAYARARGRKRVRPPESLTLFGQGPTQTLDEMIASTKRGIWVNRIGDVAGMSDSTALRTGTTRDGTFLIENGKITKAIKNLRFTESVFFILNRVEAVGTPVRGSEIAVAPRLKVRDFDFTSLTDAI